MHCEAPPPSRTIPISASPGNKTTPNLPVTPSPLPLGRGCFTASPSVHPHAYGLLTPYWGPLSTYALLIPCFIRLFSGLRKGTDRPTNRSWYSFFPTNPLAVDVSLLHFFSKQYPTDFANAVASPVSLILVWANDPFPQERPRTHPHADAVYATYHK